MFQHKQIDWWVVLKQAQMDATEWSTCTTGQSVTHDSRGPKQETHWKRPKEGFTKCNYDASFVNPSTPAKVGEVLLLKQVMP